MTIEVIRLQPVPDLSPGRRDPSSGRFKQTAARSALPDRGFVQDLRVHGPGKNPALTGSDAFWDTPGQVGVTKPRQYRSYYEDAYPGRTPSGGEAQIVDLLRDEPGGTRRRVGVARIGAEKDRRLVATAVAPWTADAAHGARIRALVRDLGVPDTAG
jgi:hypothetical protein